MDVSIITVSFNTKKLLIKCLESIREYTKGVRYEVIVVDNGSTDGSASAIGKFQAPKSKFQIIRNKVNLGFAKANNQGIKIAKGRYVLFLNSDTQVLEDSISKMVLWMDKHPQAGIATCKLVNSDKSTQATGGSFPSLWRVFLWASFLDDLPFVAGVFGSYHPHQGGYFDEEHRQDWVTGAFMLIRRKVLDTVGYWDEDFFMYGEDLEYCLRTVEAGWQVWYTPLTHIVHLGSKRTERSILGEFAGLLKIYRKHFAFWQYPVLEFLLKVAAILRILFFGILKGEKEALKIYAKALTDY